MEFSLSEVLDSLLVAYTPFVANLGLLSLLAWVVSANGRTVFVKNRNQDWRASFFIGLVFGGFASLLMLIPFKLEVGIFADSRAVPILLSGIVGGPVAGLVTTIIAFITRYSLGGAGMASGVVYIVIVGVCGLLAYRFQSKRDIMLLTVQQLALLILVATTLGGPVILLLPKDRWVSALLTLWPQMYAANLIGMVVLASLIHRELNRHDEEVKLIRADEALKEREAMLSSLTDATPAHVALLAENGDIVYVNESWKQFGRDNGAKPQKEGEYGNYLQACRPQANNPLSSEALDRQASWRDDAYAGLSAVLSGKLDCYELTYSCHSPDEGRWFKMESKPVSGMPGVKAIVTHFNVTELIKAQEELNVAKERAEAANEAKTRFLSSMSHELRTPLNAVLGFGNLLASNKKEPLTSRQAECVSIIQRSGRALLELVNQVLDLSRIESGKMDIRYRAVDLHELFQDGFDMVRDQAERRQVTLHLNDDGWGAQQQLIADKQHLRLVLINLLSNAIKYNKQDGEVSVVVEKTENQMFKVMVADTGEGIPLDRQKELFEPFNRLGREAGQIEGSGIGLTIAKRMIEAMQGTIGFFSEAGRGTTFWIELPIQPDETKVVNQESLFEDEGGESAARDLSGL